MSRPLTAEVIRPDGTALKLPKGWQSAMRDRDGSPKALYQCVVETSDGPLRVSPAAAMPFVSEWASVLTMAIKAGKITGWGSPTIVKVT